MTWFTLLGGIGIGTGLGFAAGIWVMKQGIELLNRAIGSLTTNFAFPTPPKMESPIMRSLTEDLFKTLEEDQATVPSWMDDDPA